MNRFLWVVQWLLAALFLFAGVMKFIMPMAEMTKQTSLPGWFFYFIGVAEILGAMGLIFPGLLKIRPGLTPLAALGLFIIMVGATAITVSTSPVTMAIVPLVAGLLCGFVAFGRWRLAR